MGPGESVLVDISNEFSKEKIESILLDNTTSQYTQHKNEDIKAKARISYDSKMVPLSTKQMKNILYLVKKDNFHSKSKIILLEMAQRVITKNIFQFMKKENILKQLSSQLLDIALTLRKPSDKIESVNTLKSKVLSLKDSYYKESSSLKLNNNNTISKDSLIDKNNNIPNYYYHLKKQFEHQFPYSLFHTINLNGILPEGSDNSNNDSNNNSQPLIHSDSLL